VITFLSAGVVLGLSAGFSPGPLLTLVISQTLRHGTREGIRVAFAPLVTDIPIILASLYLLTRLADYRPVLGIISVSGGLFVAYLGWETIRTTRLAVAIRDDEPQSLRTGVLVNALSPHPYLFWLTVGAPTIVKGWADGPAAAVAFAAGFYGCLIGAKVFCAVVTGRSKQLLLGNTYVWLMRVLGILLFLFALLLLKDGARLLGVPG